MQKIFCCPNCGIKLYTEDKPKADYYSWQRINSSNYFYECCICKREYNSGYLRWEIPVELSIKQKAFPMFNSEPIPAFFCEHCIKKYKIKIDLSDAYSQWLQRGCE